MSSTTARTHDDDGVAWKMDGSAWKRTTLAALAITGALGMGGVAHAGAPGVILPEPARQHGNASTHVPVPHEPVLAGSRWASEPVRSLGHDWT
jgi:hypothetical protein